MNEHKSGASFETETQAAGQTVAASGAAPINPMETVGHGEGAKGKIAGVGCAGAPPAAAGAAATSAGGAPGADAPVAAPPTATAEVGFAPAGGKDTSLGESTFARLIEAVAEQMAPGSPARREMDYLHLREELEAERRLRRLSENKLVCIHSLEEAGVPVAFADLLVTEDGAEMERRVGTFVSAVREWINREVSMKLETLSPRIGGGDTGITKAQFRAMRIAEQQEIFKNNRPLYEELSR